MRDVLASPFRIRVQVRPISSRRRRPDPGFLCPAPGTRIVHKSRPIQGSVAFLSFGLFQEFHVRELAPIDPPKRGGGKSVVELDDSHSEVIADTLPDAESLFDRVWFDTLLEHALNDLEKEYVQRGKGELFKQLQGCLAWNHKEAKLADAARELGMSPGSVRVTILRMRRRFRELIELQISETVTNPSDAAEELRNLRRILGA